MDDDWIAIPCRRRRDAGLATRLLRRLGLLESLLPFSRDVDACAVRDVVRIQRHARGMLGRARAAEASRRRRRARHALIGWRRRAALEHALCHRMVEDYHATVVQRAFRSFLLHRPRVGDLLRRIRSLQQRNHRQQQRKRTNRRQKRARDALDVIKASLT